ncbi:MAG: DUF945 family protein [Gammaproteobacteria bacterium]|nr:DUF945 family protein [Gammaproteobacteria bacterium]
MKRALIVIAVVVVVLAGAPYALGMFTESNFRQNVEADRGNATFEGTVTNYERGFRSSTARIEYGLGEPYRSQLDALGEMAAAARDFKIPVIVEIGHGPLLTLNGVQFGSAAIKAYPDPEDPFVQLIQQLLGMPYLIEVRGLAGFGTGFDFEGEIPPISSAFPDFSVDFTGLDFSGTADRGDIVANVSAESLEMQSMLLSAIVESVAASFEIEARPNGIPLGANSVSIERAIVTNPLLGANPMFALEAFSLTSDTALNASGDKLNVTAAYDIGRVDIADVFSASDAAMAITLNDIDAAAADEYYALMSQMQSQLASAGSAATELMQARMMQLADRVVAGGPSITVDPLRFTMESGTLNGRMTVSVDPSALPNGQATDLQDIAVIFGAVSAALELTVTKALAIELATYITREQLGAMQMPDGQAPSNEDIEQMAAAQAGLLLVTLTAQGLLLDDGENYSTTIEFVDGDATANGQMIPLGAF